MAVEVGKRDFFSAQFVWDCHLPLLHSCPGGIRLSFLSGEAVGGVGIIIVTLVLVVGLVVVVKRNSNVINVKGKKIY
jgi:hypothetical protein